MKAKLHPLCTSSFKSALPPYLPHLEEPPFIPSAAVLPPSPCWQRASRGWHLSLLIDAHGRWGSPRGGHAGDAATGRAVLPRSPRCHSDRVGMPLSRPWLPPFRHGWVADSFIVCRAVVFPSASSEGSRIPEDKRPGTKKGLNGAKSLKGGRKKRKSRNLCFSCRGERRKIILASPKW